MKCYKWFTRPSRHDKISSQAWLRTEFNWQRKTTMATARSGSTPQVSGWATDPSTLLLHLLAKVEDESSPKSGQNTRPVSTLNMHSASIASYYNNPTIMQQDIHQKQNTTHGKSLLQSSMASQARHGISRQLGITSAESKPGGVGSYTGNHTKKLPVTRKRVHQLVPSNTTTHINTARLTGL